MFEQDATHFFTQRPGLIARSYTRFFKKLEDEWSFYQAHAMSEEWLDEEKSYGNSIITYPHAASYFGKILCVRSYKAEYESKHRKAPVLITGVRMEDGHHKKGPHGVGFWWGFQGKCICEIESAVWEEERFEASGLEALHQQLGHLFASDRFWQVDLSKMRPLEIMELLSQELGIFVGGPELTDFLANDCIQKKEMMFGSIYQAKQKF